MSRPLGWFGVALAAFLAAGCGEEEVQPGAPASQPGAADAGGPVSGATDASDNDVEGRRTALLRSVIQLIEEAATTPGGRNFAIATDYLNHYFDGTAPAEFVMRPESRAFLAEVKLPPKAIAELEAPQFTDRDARHIEDCLLYHAVANRVAGQGDDLTKVRRLFDWISRQVALVPPDSLGIPGSLPQAQARPFDVLVRGMATEGGGKWTERGWVFMALCRQLGVDVGLVTITPKDQAEPTYWITGAAIGGKLYLFDARLGQEIPGPDGKAPATLDQILADPSVLDRLDLHGEGQPKYDVHAADLAEAKVGIALDSTLGYLSPRMRLLQRELAGKNRMVLYRDPAEQRNAFVAAFGDRFGGASLWLLPIEVEARLFTDSAFNTATGLPLKMFDPSLPLLGPRLLQLRGDLPSAIQAYVNARYRPHPTLSDLRTPIPPEIQMLVDLYATYFLALAQLDQGNLNQAENLFKQTIKFMPDPRPGPPFVSLLHWGAVSNLGRMNLDRGDHAQAVAFFTRPAPTPQGQGDLHRAEEIIAKDPAAADSVYKPEPKPAEEKPAEAKPAEEKPAEEKPAEEKAPAEPPAKPDETPAGTDPR